MKEVLEMVLMSIGILALIALLSLGLAFPLKWCWNYTMPELFGLKAITRGQAWCLHFVASLLVKSIHSHK